jgi:hypothetical protein
LTTDPLTDIREAPPPLFLTPKRYDMQDPTEPIRRQMVAEINAAPGSREALELEFGEDNVWDAQELGRDFSVLGFMAPFCVVVRKSDNVRGSVMFQHDPRFYFNFKPE